MILIEGRETGSRQETDERTRQGSRHRALGASSCGLGLPATVTLSLLPLRDPRGSQSTADLRRRAPGSAPAEEGGRTRRGQAGRRRVRSPVQAAYHAELALHTRRSSQRSGDARCNVVFEDVETREGVRGRDPFERTGQCGGNGSTSAPRESARGMPSHVFRRGLYTSVRPAIEKHASLAPHADPLSHVYARLQPRGGRGSLQRRSLSIGISERSTRYRLGNGS
jgi:hypothetical protein